MVMAIHRELVKRDGKNHLVLGMVPGNFERLIAGETIHFEVGGIVVTLVYGRTPMLAGEVVRQIKGVPSGE